jgi:hypothetical protein
VKKQTTNNPFSQDALKRARHGTARIITMGLVVFILGYIFIDIIFGK